MTRIVEQYILLTATFVILALGVAILGFGREGGYIFHGWLIALTAGWALMWQLNKITDPEVEIPWNIKMT